MFAKLWVTELYRLRIVEKCSRIIYIPTRVFNSYEKLCKLFKLESSKIQTVLEELSRILGQGNQVDMCKACTVNLRKLTRLFYLYFVVDISVRLETEEAENRLLRDQLKEERVCLLTLEISCDFGKRILSGAAVRTAYTGVNSCTIFRATCFIVKDSEAHVLRRDMKYSFVRSTR